MKSIYLDYASATYIDPLVLKKMMPYLEEYFGNSSSLHKMGRESKSIIENARRDVAKILNAESQEIIFTGSGTESDNLAIWGAANNYKRNGKHIIVSKIEHKAILQIVKKLERNGFKIDYANVDSNGLIKISELKKLIRSNTILVSIMTANNEIGTIQPVAEISKIIKKINPSVLFHTDATQAAGAVSIRVDELGIDFMSLNGSKIYGPAGIGCLYVKNGIKLEPIIVGGEQEKNLRAGTESIFLIVGFAEALKLAEKLMSRENKRLVNLRDYLIKNILKLIPNCKLNGHPIKRLPNNVNISIKGVEGEALVLMLDEYGIFASTGSACGASDLEPSHVISAICSSPELSHCNIRFSFGRKTTKQDIDYLIKVLPKAVAKLRMISSVK